MNYLKNIMKHFLRVCKHKHKVFKLCCRAGIPFQGLVHDLSKFSPTEFFEGVKYYSDNRSPIFLCKMDKGYSLAWLHHKSRNKHHPEYWFDNDSTITTPIIPYKYVVEMICDNIAAGILYQGKNWNKEYQLSFWNKKKDNILMNDKIKDMLSRIYTDVAIYGIEDVINKRNLKEKYNLYCKEDLSMKDIFILCVHRGHNASCSIMKNGEIIAVGQEERFSRIKNDIGYPKKSIDFCLKEANIQPSQISEVAYTTKGFPSVFTKAKHRVNFSIKDYMDYYGKKYKGNNNINEKQEYLKWLRDDNKFNRSTTYFNYNFLTDDVLMNNELDKELFQKEQRRTLSEHLNYPKDKIKFLDHHTCHAYYAYYASPFYDKECIVLTMDGGGDGRKMSVWKAIDNKLHFLSDSNECDVCEIYKLVTLILGMRPDQDEYKVMGLAPYAKEKYIQEIVDIFDELLEVKEMKITRKKKVDNLYLYLQEKLQEYRFDNIAGGLQKFTENILSILIKNIIKETGIKRFVLSGGISMNVKNNKSIMELEEIEDIFIPASGGDESLSIGGCYFLNREDGNNKPLENVYLGFDVKNEIINKKQEEEINKKYIVKKNVSKKEVARLIFDGKIIGRISGRAEFGARALGNRSIIGNPSNPNIVEKINSAIKNRDFWMPFAISILEKYSNEYLINNKNIKAPFMTIAFNTKQNNYERIKAGTHPKDKTARPQFVNPENNKEYYELINEFYEISGIPALLNTSFNLHGYPVVNNITDAIRTFENSGLDCLYINDDILIQKG